MRLYVIFLLCLVVTAVFAKEKSKKKDRSRNKRIDRDREEQVLSATEGGVEQDDDDEEYDSVAVQKSQPQQEGMRNPCNTQKCNRGEVCVLDEGVAVCVCQTCQDEEPAENTYKVCSTKNVTYETECLLDMDHCLCKNRQPGCINSNLKKVRLNYYGECKELTECPEDEFENFPGRMLKWLYVIMRELANRSQMNDYYELLEKANNDETHAAAALWKFCDLDIDPNDKRVTRRELMYIIASIKPMEHCLVPFLNKCDSNDDNKISMVEWGTCLGVGHEFIQENHCK